jgi:hypothetical protein
LPTQPDSTFHPTFILSPPTGGGVCRGTDTRPDATRAGRWAGTVLCVRGRRQRRVAPQDPLVQSLQVRAGVDAKLLGEALPDVLVGLQRLLLPAGPVQRDHELPNQPFPVRELGDQTG